MMYDDVVTVVENRPLTGGHFLLSVHSPRQARATRPGQFAMVRLPGGLDTLLRRPMSIYDVREASVEAGFSPATAALKGATTGADATFRVGTAKARHAVPRKALQKAPEIIQLLYKIVGKGTRLMAGLRPGDKLEMLAPLGHGFFPEDYLPEARAAAEVLHVAGGIGIAALLLAARELARQGIPQRLFFGGRTKEDLVGFEDFKPYVRATVFATENGSRGHRGFVTQPLEEYLLRNQKKKFLFMVCGPWPMLEATVGLAQEHGHRCLVSMENRMGCAIGVCLGCSIRVQGTGHGAYERVCTEGPVFWAEKVIWERESLPKA
jgi:dihydroorotate dehydrogenase electron transfer subunit